MMKKLFNLLLLALFLVGCSSSPKADKTEAQNEDKPSQETVISDSISDVIDEMKTEIEESAKELDELIDDL